jgi:putative tricarboxylic transport membrane protein
MADGIDFVPIAMGLFGVGEILYNLEERHRAASAPAAVANVWPSRKDLKQASPAIGRGSVIGFFLGVLPGGGAVMASLAAYAAEKRVAKDPSRFGRGAIEGVAGPESANNAGAQTAFIPLLTLGIPPNAVMALMVGAMTIHGIVPGPEILTKQPRLFWGMIASMWIGNLMLLVINLPLIGLWVRLLKVPYRLLFPAIVLFCCIGIYSVNNNPVDVYLTAVFGLFGYALIKFEFEPAPLLLGYVLGRLLEEKLRQSLAISRGHFATFLEHPASATLLVLTLLLMVIVVLPSIRKGREEVFAE